MPNIVDDKFWGGIDFTFCFIKNLSKIYKEEQEIWSNNPRYRFPKQMELLYQLDKVLFEITDARSYYLDRKEQNKVDKVIVVYLKELQKFSKHHKAYLNNLPNSDGVIKMLLNAIKLKFFKYGDKALKNLKNATDLQENIKNLVLNEFKMTLDEFVQTTRQNPNAN